jgi:predicted TIM-barrel fold metal-dependent hydrolase
MSRYAGPVVDTHHHIWMRSDVAWLRDPPIRRAIGDFFGLRRDIPIEEWLHDALPEGVVKSVHVTANWGAARALDETRWLQAIADQHGFPHAIVCQADLADPDVEAQLKAQKQFPNVRGVRHQLHWDSAPLRQIVSRPDLCNTPEFRRGFALLEKYDLHFELQVFASQAQYAVELIKAFPGVRFILLHAGMLTERTQPAIEQWREALTYRTVLSEYLPDDQAAVFHDNAMRFYRL